MITFETLKNYAEKSGKNYEAFTKIGEVDYNGTVTLNWCSFSNSLKDFSKTLVGIELKPNVYYWFETFGQDGELFFFERYNRLNGRSIKGHTTGYKAEELIRKFLKK